jgi:hypothetical protein
MIHGLIKQFSHPADMSEKHWSVIVRTIKSLNAQKLATQKITDMKTKFRGVERAPFTGTNA